MAIHSKPDRNNSYIVIGPQDDKNTGLNCTAADTIGLIAGGVQLITATGTTLGFFGTTPATQGTAYTQTYSTANKTHANSTYAAPAGGGTVDAECRASLAQLAVDVVDVKQLANSIIDDLQAYGLVL